MLCWNNSTLNFHAVKINMIKASKTTQSSWIPVMKTIFNSFLSVWYKPTTLPSESPNTAQHLPPIYQNTPVPDTTINQSCSLPCLLRLPPLTRAEGWAAGPSLTWKITWLQQACNFEWLRPLIISWSTSFTPASVAGPMLIWDLLCLKVSTRSLFHILEIIGSKRQKKRPGGNQKTVKHEQNNAVFLYQMWPKICGYLNITPICAS